MQPFTVAPLFFTPGRRITTMVIVILVLIWFLKDTMLELYRGAQRNPPPEEEEDYDPPSSNNDEKPASSISQD